MGQLPQRTTEGTWKYTLTAAAREAAGFLTMEEYVRRCQNTVSQYIAACYHHRIPTHTPRLLSEPSHRSNSDHTAIYCVTVFWHRLTYSSIVKKPAASLAAAVKVYFHVPSVVLRGSCPTSRLST